MENRLPKYWCVKNDGSQLFKDTVIKYLNTLRNTGWSGDYMDYYGVYNNEGWGHCDTAYAFKAHSLLTLKQFIEMTEEKFVLPKNWHVVVTEENQAILSKWRNPNHTCIVPIGYVVGADCYGGNIHARSHNPATSLKEERFDFGQEITFEQFREYVLGEKKEPEPEFVLPDKWCIKVNNQLVVDYCNKYGKIPPYYLSQSSASYAHFPPYDGGTCTTKGEVLSGYTEITLEQFKKFVLKGETKMERKIIGYKAPFAINSVVPKGTIYVKEFSNYCPEGRQGMGSEWYLPSQIVEAWEPVYEAEQFKVGDWVYAEKGKEDFRVAKHIPVFQIKEITTQGGPWLRPEEGKGTGIKASLCRLATPEEIKKAKTPAFPKITIKGYEAKFFDDHVEFGCQTYTKELVTTLSLCLERNDFDMEYREQIKIMADYFRTGKV